MQFGHRCGRLHLQHRHGVLVAAIRLWVRVLERAAPTLDTNMHRRSAKVDTCCTVLPLYHQGVLEEVVGLYHTLCDCHNVDDLLLERYLHAGRKQPVVGTICAEWPRGATPPPARTIANLALVAAATGPLLWSECSLHLAQVLLYASPLVDGSNDCSTPVRRAASLQSGVGIDDEDSDDGTEAQSLLCPADVPQSMLTGGMCEDLPEDWFVEGQGEWGADVVMDEGASSTVVVSAARNPSSFAQVCKTMLRLKAPEAAPWRLRRVRFTGAQTTTSRTAPVAATVADLAGKVTTATVQAARVPARQPPTAATTPSKCTRGRATTAITSNRWPRHNAPRTMQAASPPMRRTKPWLQKTRGWTTPPWLPRCWLRTAMRMRTRLTRRHHTWWCLRRWLCMMGGAC